MSIDLKKIKGSLLNNIELILTGVGLLVILLSGLVANRAEFWKITALVAILVGVLHGLIFWVIRRRQRLVRAEAIAQVRDMLEDLMKNKLQSVKMMLHLAELRQARLSNQAQDFQEAYQVLRHISEIIDHLSEESLGRWRHRYQATLKRIEQEQPEP
ncbi:hypothetical protein [Thermostichus vulcanus]|uniref:Uncharacterized protein n=1 Tax=Thermostichus vulcanus str. 'Rupite' TaxID=2813851 RepID=A0ABT0CEN1_THEVL|nr:hypothetical protein [Thermostichus vulcanus]MCJ2544235.1 hypothetical protein [Thermostichus vulcanus str. 'Rupite']